MRWAIIENTDNRLIIYENGDVYSMYSRNGPSEFDPIITKLSLYVPKDTKNNRWLSIRVKGKPTTFNINRLLNKYFNIPLPVLSNQKLAPEVKRVNKKRSSLKAYRKRSKNITDTYVITLLKNASPELRGTPIPQDLIELNRKKICLKRKLRQVRSQCQV